MNTPPNEFDCPAFEEALERGDHASLRSLFRLADEERRRAEALVRVKEHEVQLLGKALRNLTDPLSSRPKPEPPAQIAKSAEELGL